MGKAAAIIVLGGAMLAALMTGCAGNGNNNASGEELTNLRQKNYETLAAYDPDFAIQQVDTIIPLHGWETVINFPGSVGSPTSEKTVQVGNGHIKKLTYPGLELTLFSPKGDGKIFKIMDMRISSADYATAHNLKVGMELEDLKSVHPDITAVSDGRNDPNNSTYEIFKSSRQDHARYEVRNGVIQQIRFFTEQP